MKSIVDVLARLAQALGTSSDRGIAEALELPVATVRTWRHRGTIPYEVLAGISEARAISMDWLLFGRGGMQAPGVASVLHPGAVVDLERLMRLSFRSASPHMVAVLELLQKHYPHEVPLANVARDLGVAEDMIASDVSLLQAEGLLRQDVTGVAALQSCVVWRSTGLADVSAHGVSTLKILADEILPQVERRDGSGKLVSGLGWCPESVADQVIDQMVRAAKRQWSEATEVAGYTKVRFVLGIAKTERKQ